MSSERVLEKAVENIEAERSNNANDLRCLVCDTPVPGAVCGRKKPCPGCGFPYPSGDCSDWSWFKNDDGYRSPSEKPLATVPYASSFLSSSFLTRTRFFSSSTPMQLPSSELVSGVRLLIFLDKEHY